MSDRIPVLPDDAVLVHIGPHKTGTTAIQATLAAARPAMADHGVLYPGRPNQWHHNFHAKSLRQFADGWAEDATPAPNPKMWADLAAEVDATRGRVVLSSEFFADADAEARAKLVKDLGPDRIHLLIVARHPAALAVSMWQQVLRKGHPLSLDEWLSRYFVRTEFPERPTGFWRRADPATLIADFSDVVPLDRITVAVLEEGDRTLLPATFEQLLGLPDGLLAGHAPTQTNRSLTEIEADLLRRVIDRFEAKVGWADYSRIVRGGVTLRLLQVRNPPPDEPKLRLPQWAADHALTEAARSIARLEKLGVCIAGDLESLRRPLATTEHSATYDQVPMDLAVEAVAGAVAGGTRGNWSFDAPLRPARHLLPEVARPGRRVEEIPARELAAILRTRVRAGLRRRLSRQLSRRVSRGR